MIYLHIYIKVIYLFQYRRWLSWFSCIFTILVYFHVYLQYLHCIVLLWAYRPIFFRGEGTCGRQFARMSRKFCYWYLYRRNFNGFKKCYRCVTGFPNRTAIYDKGAVAPCNLSRNLQCNSDLNYWHYLKCSVKKLWVWFTFFFVVANLRKIRL